MHNLNMEKQKEMKSILNDLDYAKFVLFEHNFFRELSGSLMECGRNRFPDKNSPAPRTRRR